MNGFLVIARFGMDDIPMHLFASREEAEEYAKNVEYKDACEAANDFDVDSSMMVNVCVCEFSEGKPLRPYAITYI